MARPIPRLAPVTNATCPESSTLAAPGQRALKRSTFGIQADIVPLGVSWNKEGVQAMVHGQHHAIAAANRWIDKQNHPTAGDTNTTASPGGDE
jgi:hypothetical protein